jgi:hypothetical protein
MPHLFLDPTCRALIEQLQRADQQRDHLRAQLADAALQVELKEVDRNLPWGLEGEKRAQLKAEREAAIQARITKRAARRANEMRIFGSYTRPGTWDADLDNYPEPRYEEEVGDGYSVRLVRTRDLTWNAYVVLPVGHPAAGRHYDFFGGYESPAGLPSPPQHITYNAVEDGRGVYGFYLTGVVKPREDYAEYDAYNYYSAEKTGFSALADNGSVHVDYTQMRERCVGLVDYFKGLATDPKAAAICGSAMKCTDHGFYVGVCCGCVPPAPAPRAEPSLASRATLPKAPREEVSLASRATLPKKSWAAVAGGK